ncbi:MAG: 16S rRNA (cytosine(967)-C(5))-methyltransferase RsmB [Myxococcota bacterium]
MKRPVSSARRLALSVLLRVERDGAYAERVLDAALKRSHLDSRDVALATELVYGTLRCQRLLDFYLGIWATQPLSRLPQEVLLILRMGAYQITEMRTPAYSAVNEAVNSVHRRVSHLGGVVNAILRKLAAAHQDDALPKPSEHIANPVEALAVETSHPDWVVQRVASYLGIEEARLWALANNQRPPLALRVNTLRIERSALAQRFVEAGIEVEMPEAFPAALLVRQGGAVVALPGYAQGLFCVQDPAAQRIGELLAPRAGAVILDACAAPGGKSTHLGALMGNRGKVIATDIHAAKTRLIAQNAARLGTTCVSADVADCTDSAQIAAVLAKHDVAQVDCALLDAPCSGLGTLRRHPELRWRQESSLQELCALQDRLLDSVASFVKPGGVLIYAVCTVTTEEGEERLAAFLRRDRRYSLQEDAPSGPQQRLWTHRDGCDGFFVGRLVRSGAE